MALEMRKVPMNWNHPFDGIDFEGNVRYIPLLDGNKFAKDVAEWDASAADWANGTYEDMPEGQQHIMSFEEWTRPRPIEADYTLFFDQDQVTHVQMYEIVTEGTPISPVFETVGALARWLADNFETLYGGTNVMKYDEWVEFCNKKRG